MKFSFISIIFISEVFSREISRSFARSGARKITRLEIATKVSVFASVLRVIGDKENGSEDGEGG